MEKCWRSCDDEGCSYVHAESAGKARAMLAAETGYDFVKLEMERCPAMDGLRVNDANLIRAEVVGHVYCAVCDRPIHPYRYGERDQGIGLEAFDDNDDNPLDPVINWRGQVFCSESCATA